MLEIEFNVSNIAIYGHINHPWKSECDPEIELAVKSVPQIYLISRDFH